jgi:hypothetical protein
MTEINNIKEKMLVGNYRYKADARIYTDDADAEISSLITTIESQNSQIESLKAITELSVKGLEYVMTFPFLESTEDIRIIKRNCSDSLDEIVRLSNAQT